MSPAGRPPLNDRDRRDVVLTVRLTSEEREMIEAAADGEGVSMSLWVRKRAVAAARRRMHA